MKLHHRGGSFAIFQPRAPGRNRDALCVTPCVGLSTNHAPRIIQITWIPAQIAASKTSAPSHIRTRRKSTTLHTLKWLLSAPSRPSWPRSPPSPPARPPSPPRCRSGTRRTTSAFPSRLNSSRFLRSATPRERSAASRPRASEFARDDGRKLERMVSFDVFSFVARSFVARATSRARFHRRRRVAISRPEGYLDRATDFPPSRGVVRRARKRRRALKRGIRDMTRAFAKARARRAFADARARAIARVRRFFFYPFKGFRVRTFYPQRKR